MPAGGLAKNRGLWTDGAEDAAKETVGGIAGVTSVTELEEIIASDAAETVELTGGLSVTKPAGEDVVV